jgi:hypothetical protein
MNNPERTLSTPDSSMADAKRTSSALSGPAVSSRPPRTKAPDPSFPLLVTDLTPDEVIARLRKRSQLGKLPGFEHRGGHVFRVLAFGQPYDKELIGSVAQAPGRERGSSVRFSVRLLKKLPVVVVVVMALSIWPGVWVTHSLLITYFESYPQALWITSAWYIPLCLIAIPALWKQYKRSIAEADKHAQETAAAIGRVIEAEGM